MEYKQKWHDLKTDSEAFFASMRGDKPFEIRFNDREFEPADYLILRETIHSGAEMKKGMPLKYTGRTLTRMVTYVLDGYGVKDGWVILGVRVV